MRLTKLLTKNRLRVSVDIVDSFFYCCYFFSFFVWNFSLEFLFKSHHEFYCVQRICAEVFNKGGFDGDFIFLNSQLFTDQFPDSFFNGTHSYVHSYTLQSKLR